MKKKRLFVAFAIGTLLTLAACNNAQPAADTRDPQIKAIYDLYAASTENPKSYDEWLASIKGQDGKDGKDGKDGQDGKSPVVAINEEGYWTIDGVSTGVKAQGQDATVNPFVVTFDSNGGSEVAQAQMDHVGRVAKPEDPTMPFHVFEGWFTEDGEKWVFSKDVVAENTTLFAHWKFDEENYSMKEAKVLATSGDSEFTVWTASDFVGHTKDGWQTGCSINMSWRTIAVIDGEGDLAYSVIMPANGYGSPHGTTYARNEKYADFKTNPAFKFGEEYETNNADWQLVVPEGGFVITSHTNGANRLVELVTNGAMTEASDATIGNYNKSNSASPVAKFDYDKESGVVVAYYQRHYLSLAGTVNDLAVYPDAQGEYTVKAELNQWNRFVLSYGTTVLNYSNTTFVGAVIPQVGGADWTDRLYDEDGSGTFFRGANGKATYVITYNPKAQQVRIALEGKVGTLATTGYLSPELTDGQAFASVTFAQWNRLVGVDYVKDGKAVHADFTAFAISGYFVTAYDGTHLYVEDGVLLTPAAGNFGFTFDLNEMTLVISQGE